MFVRKGIAVFIGFIFFTIIGTLSHELGHIAVAEHYGYETTLHYGSMNYDFNYEAEDTLKADSLYQESLKYEKDSEAYKAIAKENAQIWAKYNNQSLWITLGGPIQTMLTGLFGFFLLWKRQKSIQEKGMQLMDWLFLFLSLFWSRQIFNPVTSILECWYLGVPITFGGDEGRIAEALGLHNWTVSPILGLVALFFCFISIFVFLPKKERLMFIVSGFFGGIAGFYLWMTVLGPMILP